MKFKCYSIITVLLVFAESFLFCQNKHEHLPSFGTLTGSVTEEESGVPLSGATIIIHGTNNGASSDNLGNFKIETQKGFYVLRVTHIGYASILTDSIKVNAGQKVILNFKLTTRNPDSAFWQSQARKDITQGDVHLITGLLALPVPQPVFDSIVARYGFRYFSDCTADVFGTRYYNQAVIMHLDSLNGKDWDKRLDLELYHARKKK